MRICFVGPANSYHIQKWCKYFSGKNYKVEVVSFTDATIENVMVHYIKNNININASDGKKIKYLLYAAQFRKIIKNIKPDIIHVHYATSYGMVMALSGIRDYFLSVWGSDIYTFPKKSIFHENFLKYSLFKAKYLCSTSRAMAKETQQYTCKQINITPFGVDLNLFCPKKSVTSSEKMSFIVGTVKGLKPKYGIDYLLRATAKVRKLRPDIPIKLRIAGEGIYEKEYKTLAVNLNIDNITTWLDFIPQEEASKEWEAMDLAVVYSIDESESFGVSAVEAQACGTPIIISDIPGLMEATEPGNTSIVVPRENDQLLAESIINVYDCYDEYKKMGERGRVYVMENYEINKCFEIVEQLYKDKSK